MSTGFLTVMTVAMFLADIFLGIIVGLQGLKNAKTYLMILFSALGGAIVVGIGYGIYQLCRHLKINTQWLQNLGTWLVQYGWHAFFLYLSVLIFFLLLVTITHRGYQAEI